MFSLWSMVRHVRQWFCHSAAVEMVVNGVLRTLWVMSRRVRFMGICVTRLSLKGMLAFRACFSTQYGRSFPLACFKHAALTGIDGSWTEINVESPACGARSKTTIVRKPPMEQVVFYRYYMLYHENPITNEHCFTQLLDFTDYQPTHLPVCVSLVQGIQVISHHLM